ncbi:hypothetical protein [Rhodanobacter sp. Root561]|uniref:hypothetical protein n=1 Tax=Rhodanobacter sp. Root561 TaxID=1736560 RepID=UPI001F1F93D3|nr:hypothetical protein [Rhodanobacter sp. Root561]
MAITAIAEAATRKAVTLLGAKCLSPAVTPSHALLCSKFLSLLGVIGNSLKFISLVGKLDDAISAACASDQQLLLGCAPGDGKNNGRNNEQCNEAHISPFDKIERAT